MDGLMDRPMDGLTDGRTDKASYRDAWTHLKISSPHLAEILFRPLVSIAHFFRLQQKVSIAVFGLINLTILSSTAFKMISRGLWCFISKFVTNKSTYTVSDSGEKKLTVFCPRRNKFRRGL